MRRTEFGFEDPLLGEEERLVSLLALNRGLFSAWDAVCRRLDGYSGLVGEELDGNAAGLAYLGRLTRLVESAGAWPREAAGLFGSEREFESISLRPLLEGAIDRCSKVLAPDVGLELRQTDSEMVVSGIFFELQQVMVRVLLRYARECAEECSKVFVSSREVTLDDQNARMLDGFDESQRIVQVTFGTGSEPAPPAEFEPFWDVVLGERSDVVPDLRLIQIYGTILQHGGDMRFRRSEDDAQLCVLLPATIRRKEMQVVSDIEDQSLYGSETILLVDDEDMIWDVIIDMLQELGYSVVLAGNGLEALEVYRENPGSIDLVILDMIMPELDGHRAFFKLREIDPETRVLLSSGYVSEDDVQDVLKAGAAGFLRKPYRMVDLARKVRSILDG